VGAKKPLAVRPVWKNQKSLHQACIARDIRIGNKKMGTLETELIGYCNEGVNLEKYTPRSMEQNCVETCDRTALGKCLKERDLLATGSTDELRDRLRDVLELEDQLQLLEQEKDNPLFENLDDAGKKNTLLSDVVRMVLCILHAEMRMGEKVLTLLFKQCLGRSDISLGERETCMDNAAAHLVEYANLGAQWTWRYEKGSPGKLDKIQMEKKRVRRCLNKGKETEAIELVKLLLSEAHPKYHAWVKFLEAYLPMMAILTQKEEYTADEPIQFQKLADTAYMWLVKADPHDHEGHEAAAGEEAITNYFHCLGAGHFYELMNTWGNLMRFRNEGVEAMNADVKARYLKHSQRGGIKGGGESRSMSGKAEGLGRWLTRRFAWATGLAWEWFGADKKPQHLVDEEAWAPSDSGSDSDSDSDDPSDSDDDFESD
jgi:hypothetical protein